MNTNPISKAILLSLFSALFLISCRTEPNTTKELNNIQFKHAGSKTVYTGLPSALNSLNPISASSAYPGIVYSNIFQPLMDIDISTYEVVPVLAQSKPEIKELKEGRYAGGVSYTYQIKEGAVWDDGSPVTAKDVAFSIKVVFAPKIVSRRYTSYFSYFKEIQIDPDNSKKFTIFLAEKYFQGEEASAIIRVMPEYIYDPKKVLRNFNLADLIDTEKRAKLARTKQFLHRQSRQSILSYHTRPNSLGDFY